jgi:hypothetical protein
MSRSLKNIKTLIAEEIHTVEPPNLESSTKIELDKIPSVERVLAHDRL